MLERIEREAGVPLRAVLSALAPTDARSVLLELMRAHAQRSPAQLLAQYEADGCVAPAPLDARAQHALDGRALEAARDFEAVVLAPVSPLGLNAVLGGIDQNNVLATVRNTEVLADPTAALALECAVRRRRDDAPVRLCAVSTVIRMQPVEETPGMTRHFRLLSLVSAFRGRVEPEIDAHVRVYQELLGGTGEVELLPEGNAYYARPRLRIHATDATGETYAIVDGGMVDWTQRLLSNRKERLFTSAIGLSLLGSRFADRGRR